MIQQSLCLLHWLIPDTQNPILSSNTQNPILSSNTQNPILSSNCTVQHQVSAMLYERVVCAARLNKADSELPLRTVKHHILRPQLVEVSNMMAQLQPPKVK